MSFKKSLWEFLGFRKDFEGDDIVINKLKTKFAISDLAYEICVQRIAKAICKCEYRTYKNGKEDKGTEYYRLNIRPNPNQTATEFWQAVVEKLYDEQEALLISEGSHLYLADGFLRNENGLKPDTFEKVTIGTYKSNKIYAADEVAFLSLSNQRIKNLLKSTMDEYGELMDVAANAYKNGVGMKAKLHINNQARAGDDKADEKIKKALKAFYNETNSCYIEREGYNFQPFDTSRKGTQQSTRDIKAILDDVLEMTSKAFLIPSNIANGEVTDTSKAVDDFLTFCLDSVLRLIEDGLNNALYTDREYLAGTKVKVNAQTIKHVDVLDASAAIDKLISCGAKSVNDILRIMGDEPIDEEWANVHWITKNYTSIDTLTKMGADGSLTTTEGGAINETENAGVPE